MLKWIFCWLPLALLSQNYSNVVDFPQPENSIGLISQIIPQKDTIWVVANGKIYFHNGYDFYPLSFNNSQFTDDALSIAPADSGLWIGFYTKGVGFYHFKKSQLIWPFSKEKNYPSLPDQRVGAIFSVSDTGLWVQSHHSGVAFISLLTPKIKSFLIQNFGAESMRGKNIVSQFVPHPTLKNNYLATTLGGVFVFDLTTQTYSRFYDLSQENCVNPSLCNGNEISVRCIYAKDQWAWLGTWGGGLIKLNLNSGKFQKFAMNRKGQLFKYFQNFKSIYALNDSLINLTDVDVGVVQFNCKKEKFTLLKNSFGEVLIPKVYSISNSIYGQFYGGNNQLYLVQNKESIWSVKPTNFPVIRFKKQAKSPLALFQKQSKDQFLIQEDLPFLLPFNGNLLIDWHRVSKDKWVAVGLRQVYFLGGNKAKELQLPWKKEAGSSAEIISSYFDIKSQTLWLGTKSWGAYGYQIKTQKWIFLNEGSFRRFWIKDIVPIEDKICFLGEQQFHFYSPKSGEITRLDFNEITNLPTGFIPRKMLVASKSRLYLLSTKSGFYRIDLLKTPTATPCVLPQKVAVESFFDATICNDGFYLASSHGLVYYSEKNGATLLGESYKLGEVKQVEMTQDTLWFLHNKEVHYWVTPDVFSLKKNYPKVEITQFEVMGNLAKIKASHRLKYHQNWLAWKAVSSDFTNPQVGEVQAKLNGFSDQWRTISANQAYSISNLKPGKYTLVARVKTRDNGFGPEQTLMQITIVPAWFQTWWFFFGLLLALVFILYALYQWRMHQLKQKQAVELQLQSLEMRMLQVQMNPHFIFNALNSVKYYILKENRTLASDYLARFSKLLRFILSISKREKISLREELDALTNYIEFECIRFNHKFSFSILVDENINTFQTEIQPMLIQPFVENAIWHGLMPLEREAKLSLDIKVKNHQLLIEIEDNGVGRTQSMQQKNKAHKSFGLNITTERLQALAKKTGKIAQFKIIDLNQNGEPTGTLVQITLPYERINS